MARDMAPEVFREVTKNPAEEIRAMWTAELRRQGHRQCFESYTDQPRNLVCALGLLREVALPLNECDHMDDVSVVGALAGLSERQAYGVTYMNDGLYDFNHKHTFSDIADAVEGWFK